MSDFETIIYEKKDGVGYLTLNRPQALNAYNIKMRDELWQVLSAIKEDDDVRVVILKGAGERAFCAGADLTEFLTSPSPIIAREVRWERDVWGLWLSIEKPFVVALHGYVLGDGVEMMLCCDIRVASEDAQFGTPEMGLGIITAAGGSQTLPRVVGRAHALDMLITGRWIKADEARRMNLVNQVVSRAELLPTVQAIADRIKAFDPRAVSYAKQAVTRGLDLSLERGLEVERKLRRMLA